MSLPDGYVGRRIGDVQLVASEPLADTFAMLLADGVTLYDWAAAVPQPHALRGRAPVYVATLPDTDIPVVVRHAWHGGLLAPITGDRFRAPTRAPAELANSQRLRAAGVATSEILAYALYPASGSLMRVDVATRFIPDAYDLGMVLAELAPGWTWARAEPLVVRALAGLAFHHVLHPDLNVKNVLLAAQIDSAYVIDVDVVRDAPALSIEVVMRTNLRRLKRSMRKWQRQFGARITDADIAAFEADCLAQLDGGVRRPHAT